MPPASWYPRTATVTATRDKPKRRATAEAMTARSTDLAKMTGSMAWGGIPVSRWLASGESTAVASPAASPNRHAAMRVKK